MIPLILALTLAAADAPAVAGVDVSPPPAAETSKQRQRRLREEAANTMVCRDILKTGTNLRENVCRTQGDWDKIQREAQRASMRYQQDGMRGLMPGAH